MDTTAIVVAIIAAFPITLTGYWSYKSHQDTKSVNGKTIAQDVHDLSALFITHDSHDQAQFEKITRKHGALSEAIMKLDQYSHDRWHKDDNRYTVLLGFMSILGNPKYSVEDRERLTQYFLDKAMEIERETPTEEEWDGTTERRSSP